MLVTDFYKVKRFQNNTSALSRNALVFGKLKELVDKVLDDKKQRENIWLIIPNGG